MATFWRYFRVSGDSQQSFDPACFTLEIHHGGYWMHLDNERRKYKGGSVHYLDGVDPETCCWVECNNIAYDLGYRVRPISYWYKLPRTTKSEGFYPIRNDVDAVKMTEHIPPRKRVMELYITGGGQRQIKEAELDDKIPKPNGWHNPLNTLLPSELAKQKHIDVAVSHHVNVTDDINGDVVVTNNVKDVTLYDDVAEDEVNGDTNGYLADDDFNVDATPANNIVLEVEILEDEAAQALRKKKGKAKFMEGGSSKKFKGKKSAKPREYNTRYKGEKSVGEGDLEDETTDEEDKDFFVESDFDHSEEDDDIFFEKEVEEHNAIEEFQEMGYACEISDDAKGSDADLTSLEGSGSEEDENGNMVPVNNKAERKFKQFHQEVDMRNPVFEIGMKFPNATVLKNAIREYSVLNKKKIWFELNRRFKVQAKCGWNRPANKKNKKAPKQDSKRRGLCPWRIYASSYDDKSPDSLMIKGLTDEHNCGQVKRVYHLTSTWMAKKYVGEWRLNPNWSVEGFQQQVANDLGMSISQQMVYRTKHKAAEMNAGAYEEQYNKLESYAAEMRRSNPGSSVFIHSQMDGEVRKFKRMYICWDACKRGFLEGCRKVIGLDGCHIKGAYPGQLLSAVGIDGNNGMFPIAYAIAEIESKDSWLWFLELLMRDLYITHDIGYVIISDKQKGLLPAVEALMPNAQHRHCVRHLYNNFKAEFPGIGLKQLVWSAARDTTEVYWRKHMEELKIANWFAWDWLAKKNPVHWCKAFFLAINKCDLLVNNLCEAFNGSIIKSRDKPIIPMLEMIRINMMVRMANRRNAGANWNGGLGPRIQRNLKKYAEKSHNYNTAEGSHMQYQVTGQESKNMHAVDLAARTCTCKRWDISGIPCQHAIAAIYAKEQDPALYVDECYSQEKYLLAYGHIIHPIAGEDYWPHKDAPLEPPPYKAQPGRPKKLRIREPGEVEPPAQKETILKRTFFVQVTCRFCKGKGHNIRGCHKRKALVASQSQAQASEPIAQGQPQSRAQASKVTAQNQLQSPAQSQVATAQSQPQKNNKQAERLNGAKGDSNNIKLPAKQGNPTKVQKLQMHRVPKRPRETIIASQESQTSSRPVSIIEYSSAGAKK